MIDLKPYVETLNGKPVAVFGLARSGLSTVKALVKAGAEVYAWDDREEVQEKASKLGATVKTLNKSLLKKCANLILAPGVPLHHPKPHAVVEAARAVGCEVIGDIEIFHRINHGRKTLALTGTNGKSTTVTLMQHVLKESGCQSILGGNIGLPILEERLPPKKGGVVVLELSSFQIDLSPTYQSDVAVLLNITPDHLDRHGTMAEYIAVKENIFRGQGAAIICIDDDNTKDIYKKLSTQDGRTIIPVSVTEKLEYGVYVVSGVLYDRTGEGVIEVGSLNGIRKLHGLHNHQNAAATYAAMRVLGLEPQEIMEAMKTYEGLAHRQFPVRTINGVVYINDSKATNAEATSKALVNYENIYWIVGGRKKDGGLQGLEPYSDRIKHAFLIGETVDEFADWMEQQGIEYERSQTLDIAIDQAHFLAQKSRGQPGASGAVMLSPACSSYDQFESFEKRGDHFTDHVNALDEEAAVE